MTQISVIIPTYNRAEVLRRNLNLLSSQTLARSEFEVIITDDGSTDDTARLLQEWAGKSIINLKTFYQENSGQGVARNKAIDRATGEILLFLGDDILPAPGLLEAHLKFHILHPEQAEAAIGLTTWHPEIRVTRFMRWLIKSGTQFKFYDLQKETLTDYRRFYTSNISLKRKFLGDERFDSDFHGWGFEDIELGYRLQEKGMQLRYWPEARGEHYHEIDTDSFVGRQKNAGKNAVLLQRKHPKIKVIANGWKFFLQKLVSILLPFTFYGRTKKYFLAGVEEAEGEVIK